MMWTENYGSISIETEQKMSLVCFANIKDISSVDSYGSVSMETEQIWV